MMSNKRNGVLAVIFFAILLIGTIPAQAALSAPERPAGKDIAFNDLPIQARFAVSETLGRDRADYHVQNRDSNITARNAGQSYSVDFSENGVTFQKGAAKWGMALAGWGYGDELEPAEAVKPHTDKNRVEYRRGNLTEWYVNGPMGLQQGFTIDSAPKNRGKGETLQVRLEMTGGLTAKVDPDGRGVTLMDKNGASVFRYGGLTVFDADGRDIPARLTADAGNLTIDVDDRNAMYPLTIDPLVETAKLKASDLALGDSFGNSVAADGDTIVVGAQAENNGQGSAYVFTYSGGAWTQSAKLTASDGAAHDNFGHSVSISGDAIVVGTYLDDSYRGSAYVFVKPAGGWIDATETAKLTPSDGVANDWFGISASISGDAIVVGAMGDDSYRGSAYVFVKPDTGWIDATETAKLTASDRAANDYFGYTVSISGDAIVAGAHGNDDSGSAYVFVKPGSGWSSGTETAKLTASDGVASDCFGGSVSISGDTIVAGAYGDESNIGSAYVFIKPDTGWSSGNQTAKLTASDGAAGDYFGAAAAIDGDTIVVGALYDAVTYSNQGSAYVFKKPDCGWIDATETAKLTASDGADGDQFGDTVAVSGDTVVVGEYHDDETYGDSGAVFVYDTSVIRFLKVITAGSGTVTSSPAAINCPGTCSNVYYPGTSVTLTATPTAGSVLDSWTGADCPGNPAECTITLDNDYTVTATFNTDSDGDGISDSSEDAGPDGGDGNSDGYLDSTQSYVATFKDTNGNWVTMVSMGDLAESVATGNPSPGDFPTGVTPACGFFGFKLDGLIVGASTTLTIVLHTQDTTIDDYYKYGPTPSNGTNHWYQFLDDGTSGASISHTGGKTYITLRLKDGGPGDDDLTANGSITDVGGPAVSAGVGGAPGSSSGGGGGGGGCFITILD